MKHVKSRFEGINGLAADYYWYSNNGKKDRNRGIEGMENWLANIIPVLDGEEPLLRASLVEVLIYNTWTKPVQKWKSLSLGNKLAVIGILIQVIVQIIIELIKR